MSDKKEPLNVGGQAEKQKLEQNMQQVKASQSSPAPEPAQPPTPGRRPLFRVTAMKK